MQSSLHENSPLASAWHQSLSPKLDFLMERTSPPLDTPASRYVLELDKAVFINKPVVTSGNVITARMQQDARVFADTSFNTLPEPMTNESSRTTPALDEAMQLFNAGKFADFISLISGTSDPVLLLLAAKEYQKAMALRSWNTVRELVYLRLDLEALAALDPEAAESAYWSTLDSFEEEELDNEDVAQIRFSFVLLEKLLGHYTPPVTNSVSFLQPGPNLFTGCWKQNLRPIRTKATR